MECSEEEARSAIVQIVKMSLHHDNNLQTNNFSMSICLPVLFLGLNTKARHPFSDPAWEK